MKVKVKLTKVLLRISSEKHAQQQRCQARSTTTTQIDIRYNNDHTQEGKSTNDFDKL